MRLGTISSLCLHLVFQIVLSARQYREYTIEIHAAEVKQKDSYQCISTSLDNIAGQYIAGFKLNASISNIHHMALAFCGEYNANSTIWDCYHQQGDVCIGASKDVAGYNGGGMGNNNFLFMYPEDVGIKIGKDAGFYNLVSQVHFKNPNHGPSIPGTVKLFLVDNAAMRYNRFSTVLNGYIPAKTKGFSAETACKWRGVEVFPYSFDTHTHERGYHVEGYRIRNGTWTLIGQGGPHIDDGEIQSSEEDGSTFTILPGDVIATRCLFDNDEDVNIEMGLNHASEMCNFGIKFKYRPEDEMVYYRGPMCQSDIQSFDWCSMEETLTKCNHR